MKILVNNVFQKSRGQTIIESLVAFLVLIMVLSAVVAVVVVSVSNATFIRNQNLANRYAQEAMEYLRDLEKNNFYGQTSSFNNYTGSYCMRGDKSINAGACDVSNPLDLLVNTFKRDLDFQKNSNDCRFFGVGAKPSTQVIVTVSWSSSKCPAATLFCHKSQLASCFNSCGNNPACERRGELHEACAKRV